MNKAIMFLNDLTAIDHAYINQDGKIVGGSYHLSVEVEGKVDPVENVVVDFSSIKKEIKDIVDDNYNGYDHKLWIIKNFSKAEIINEKHIRTPALDFDASSFAIRHINNIHPIIDSGNFLKKIMENELSEYITDKLSWKHKDIKVTAFLEENFHLEKSLGASYKFRYTHGLKNSTSWGCQNPCHGHLSFLQFKSIDDDSDVYQDIADELNNSVFIWDKNVYLDSRDQLTVRYYSPRGEWFINYEKSMNKLVILNTETTVENLLEWFAHKYKEELSKVGCSKIFMSEGLSKGAVKYI